MRVETKWDARPRDPAQWHSLLSLHSKEVGTNLFFSTLRTVDAPGILVQHLFLVLLFLSVAFRSSWSFAFQHEHEK